MKHAFKLAVLLFLGAGAAGCGIGEGSTIETLEVEVQAVDVFEQGTYVDAGTPTERYHMYDCFCSNIAVIGTFTDGTTVNFVNRARLSSSNEAIVEVMNVGETDEIACPAGQQFAGLLIPRGLGTATITATFAGLTESLTVEVADTSAGAYALSAAPPNNPASTDVAVGATLPLQLTGTLDDRARTLTRNVVTWSFDNDDDDLATIDTTGALRGVGRTGAAPRVARASFGTCTDVSPTATVNVGDLVEPLLMEREGPGFTADAFLAVNTSEELKVTTGLDFDGDGLADGTQQISSQIALTYTDACTLREHDTNFPPSNCRDTATECANSVGKCADTTATSCPVGMTACRVEDVPMLQSVPNTIVAAHDNGTPTRFTATFPGDRGAPTALAADLDGTATTLTVQVLSGYPLVLPWFAVIDQGGTREDVRVTAVSGTTLTVVRGVGGTAAAAHLSGASFAMRTYDSDPVTGTDPPKLPVTAKDGTLTTVAIEPPGTLVPSGTLQLAAQGTFVDSLSASRQQRVTRLLTLVEGAPTVDWTSSDVGVALVTINEGLAISTNSCGGRTSVRARATTSADDTTATFDPDTTADDDACKNTDPLCDQIEMCVATPNPLPLGLVCDTPTTCP
ncbi:MAG: hypothetical protein ACT4PK_07060 [Gammaproteobacteria bacterium]